MKKLIERFSGLLKGSITGFDRIVFKGFILPLMSAGEIMRFCKNKKVLNKDYKSWMMAQTKKIVDHAGQFVQNNCGHGITHLPTWRTRKESLAHERQQQDQIEIRLQTWFPYHLQICLNGREWLRRSLEKEKIDFLAKGNKFLHIADYDKAQQLLGQQLDTRFAERVNSFLPQVFPTMQDTLGSYYSYYWTLWQSEWATDLVFSSPDKRESVMSSLLRYAHITGTSTAVLRCLDRPLTRTGNLINDQAIRL